MDENYMREKAFMDKLFESSPEAISVSDREGTVVRVNSKFLELFGFTKEEVIGRNIDRLIAHGTYHDEAVEITRQVSEKGKTIECESARFRNDGSPVEVSIIATPISSGDHFLGGYGIYRDITERRATESQLARQSEELKELNAAKDRFFSIIAHDLKSPFNNILGFTEVLMTDLGYLNQDEIRKYISFIQNSSNQAYTLLENLLIWARTQTGKIVYEPEDLNLRSAILFVMELINHLAKEKCISISCNVPEHLIIKTDMRMIEVIIRNLITNAIKFTPRNGKIEISVIIQKDQIEIFVSDTGVGIPRENMDFLFKIDQKTTSPGTEKEPGTGLGLIICREFVKKLGGQISVESEPGRGSTFSFTIPVHGLHAGKTENIRRHLP